MGLIIGGAISGFITNNETSYAILTVQLLVL